MPADRPVLVAPDSFKGTLSAGEVATSLAAGLTQAGWRCDRCPVADGGDGTLDVLAEALAGERLEVPAHDPLGRPLTAELALIRDGRAAIVETARASGLALVDERERDPEAASTAGTGELIAAAVEAGAREVLVGTGGSATTDGGAGAIGAIAGAGGLRGARLVVLCDVRTPFEEAARVFAPQKGADPGAVARLSSRLRDLASTFARDPRGVPMTGAAGGLAGGLWAELGARLEPGGPFVLEAIGFDARMREAQAVITGEGRLDATTLEGKVVAEVATRARQGGVPCHAVCGQNAMSAFDARILDLQRIVAAPTLADLEDAGAFLAANL